LSTDASVTADADADVAAAILASLIPLSQIGRLTPTLRAGDGVTFLTSGA